LYVALDTQRTRSHVETGCCRHVSANVLSIGMTEQAEAIIRGAGELVAIFTRRMHIMTTRTGEELGAVPILRGLDEVCILLMVLLGMLVITPKIARAGCVVTEDVGRQIIGPAGARQHHLIVFIERVFHMQPIGIIA